ncbi:MAG: putative zinc-binding peptidase [Chitinophagales bacterium]|nr:putative zinc-binding peptidase [Hyphomicrobiales bacterium]
MRIFECEVCRQLLYFENTVCVNCGNRVGFQLTPPDLLSLAPETDKSWRDVAEGGKVYKFCANTAEKACNWLIPIESEAAFCEACKFNHTIPDLSDPINLLRWQRLEIAKHRLIYTLTRLGLPLVNKLEDPVNGLAFDFIADVSENTWHTPKVMTGHENGLITINLSEADDSARESMRGHMGEPYRTLLGHLRHEIGHHYWELLVRDTSLRGEFREMFGDESADYGASLASYYKQGPISGWQETFVSAYASSHPWEDFAETWAHYLHIVDTLETARAFRLRLDPVAGGDPDLRVAINFNPFEAKSMDTLIQAWLPLTYAVNSLNRSMGQPDLYPFILSISAIQKLAFIHKIVRP